MSGKYYDNKGIEHSTESKADWANGQYLREEQEAREKVLAMQKQQLQAVEQLSKQAEAQRLEQARAQQAQLSELKHQGRQAQRDRDYERQLVFLRECDEATRLETHLEMLLSKIDWKSSPGINSDTYGDWKNEHDKALALIYRMGSIPAECQSGGAIIERIKSLAGADTTLMRKEADRLSIEIYDAQGLIKKKGGYKLVIASVVFLIFSGIMALDNGSTGSPQQTKEAMIGFFAIGVILGAAAIGRRAIQKVESLSIAEKIRPLVERRGRLEAKIHAADLAYDNKSGDCRENIQKWEVAVRNVLLKDFYGQGLWIEDKFVDRLKSALNEVQKPFPTSCRANVDGLQPEQVQAAYQVVATTVAGEIAAKLGRHFEASPFLQSLLSGFRQTPIETIKDATTSYVSGKGSDPSELIYRNLDIQSQKDAYMEVLSQAKVRQTLPEYLEANKRHKEELFNSLMRGPS